MKIYAFLNSVQNKLLIPFSLSSLFLIISQLFLFLSDITANETGEIFLKIYQIMIMMVSYVFCYFFIYMYTDGKRGLKSFWSVMCLVMISSIISDTKASSLLFPAAIILCIFSAFCYNNFDIFTGSLFVFVISLIFSVGIIYIDSSYNDFVMGIAKLISDKKIISSFLFGLIKLPLSLINASGINDSIFHYSFGGSYFINESIVTGAKDLFSSGYRGECVYSYLSGHYFVLFLITGAYITLLDELKGIQKVILSCTFAASILSGNIFLFVLYVFFESPMLLIILSLLSSGCYVVSYLLKLDVGYIYDGSLIEMLFRFDNGIYLIAVGIVFVCIGFFTTRLAVTKYSISDKLNIYYPSRLNAVVKALGGVNNIVRAKKDYLIVRNPELVDKLTLECEINANNIKSADPDFEELIKYI